MIWTGRAWRRVRTISTASSRARWSRRSDGCGRCRKGATPELTLGVVSCQLYPGGLFNAYDALSKLERLDAIVHLGDYIYEYGAAAEDYGMTSGRR